MRTRIIFSILLLSIAAACRTPLPEPKGPTARTNLTFSGPADGWPPRPIHVTNVQVVTSIPGALTETMVPGLRAFAEANAEVRAALGARFAFVSAGQVEPNKQTLTAARPFRLVYFSHERNVGIDVVLDRERVLRVTDLRGYQPPAGLEEMAQAIELARRDPRASAAVANLQGDAIRIDPREGQPGYGNRILYVAFSSPESDHTEYAAIVDLTRQQMLSFTTVSSRGGKP